MSFRDTFFDRASGEGGGAGGGNYQLVEYGWNRDLQQVPNFRVDPQSGITVEQFEAGLYIDADGALNIDAELMRDAGAAAVFHVWFYLDDWAVQPVPFVDWVVGASQLTNRDWYNNNFRCGIYNRKLSDGTQVNIAGGTGAEAMFQAEYSTRTHLWGDNSDGFFWNDLDGRLAHLFLTPSNRDRPLKIHKSTNAEPAYDLSPYARQDWRTFGVEYNLDHYIAPGFRLYQDNTDYAGVQFKLWEYSLIGAPAPL